MPTLPAWLTDAQIEIGVTPTKLDGATARGVLWQAMSGRFLLNVPDVARYYVEGGHRVCIEPAPDASETQVDQFLHMTPLAALLYQRGILVFHAAAVSNTNGVILLAGDSGAGKSMLVATLLRRGWRLLADELAIVDSGEGGAPMVLPTFPEVVLWQNVIEKLGARTLRPTESSDTSVNRRVLSLPDQAASGPQPARAIYWLSICGSDTIETSEPVGAERFRALGTLSYSSHIADALLDRAAYFRQARVIVQSVSVRQVYRPRGQWCVDELADIVERA